MSSACLMKSWDPLRLTKDKIWKMGKNVNAGQPEKKTSRL